MKKLRRTSILRHTWFGPMLIIGGLSLLLIVLGNLIDTNLHPHETKGFFSALFAWDQSVAEAFFSNHLAQVIGALLALAITVVSIVVQMAATQITPRVTELFLKERTNFFV